MRILMVLLSLILVAGFVPLYAAHSAFQAGAGVLAPDFISDVARDAHLVENLLAWAAGEAAKTLDFPVPVEPDDIHLMLTTAAPPALLYDMLDQTVDEFFFWFSGPASLPRLVVNLDPIREALPGAVYGVLAERLLELPACSKDEERRLLEEDATGDGLPCQPSPDNTHEILEKSLPGQQIQEILPPEVDVTVWLEGEAGHLTWVELRPYRDLAGRLVGQRWLSWVMVAAWLALIGLLNRDRAAGWMGAALILAGTGVTAVSMLAGPALTSAAALTAAAAGEAGNILSALLISAVDRLVAALASFYGPGAAAAGLLLLAVTAVTRWRAAARRRRREQTLAAAGVPSDPEPIKIENENEK